MFPLKKVQINELRNFAYIADKEARSDLIGGYIRDENDYTSNFTGALRRIINSNSKTGLSANSYLLKPALEKKYGCDATIIIYLNGFAKIAIFEAKLPRFKTSFTHWDYPQTSTGLSHFSDQIDRQSLYNGKYAIFEIFYCIYDFGKQPKFMNDEVSSCVWHSDAYTFDSTRSSTKSIWSDTELTKMLTSHNLNITDILDDVCSCKKGKEIEIPKDPKMIISELGFEGEVLFIDASTETE